MNLKKEYYTFQFHMEEKQVTNQPTATRASSQLRSFGNCSYPGDGEPISGIWNHCRE